MTDAPSLSTLVLRGLERRCPRCGEGRIYQSWHAVNERCPVCDLLLDPNGESFGIYYALTVCITGALIIWMIIVRPASITAGFKLLVPGALVLYLGTEPFRKGLAIALNHRFNPPRP